MADEPEPEVSLSEVTGVPGVVSWRTEGSDVVICIDFDSPVPGLVLAELLGLL